MIRFWFWYCVIAMGIDIWWQSYLYAAIMLGCALYWSRRGGGPRVRT